ncbi:hypothetical protein YC2023_024652 [Brassica napus]
MFHRSRIRVSCFALSSSQRPSLDIKGGRREEEDVVVDAVDVDAVVVDVDTKVEDVRRRKLWWMPCGRREEEDVVVDAVDVDAVVVDVDTKVEDVRRRKLWWMPCWWMLWWLM